jgi:hypothetical protein
MNIKPIEEWVKSNNQHFHWRTHAHFMERASISRRELLKRGLATGAVAFGSALAGAADLHSAAPGGGAPNPVPGGTDLAPFGFFHFYFPTVGPPGAQTIASGQGDPSLITDFNGTVGLFECSGGTGTATTESGNETQYWAADVRFMNGEYIDVHGRHKQGTFTFI